MSLLTNVKKTVKRTCDQLEIFKTEIWSIKETDIEKAKDKISGTHFEVRKPGESITDKT